MDLTLPSPSWVPVPGWASAVSDDSPLVSAGLKVPGDISQGPHPENSTRPSIGSITARPGMLTARRPHRLSDALFHHRGMSCPSVETHTVRWFWNAASALKRCA